MNTSVLWNDKMCLSRLVSLKLISSVAFFICGATTSIYCISLIEVSSVFLNMIPSQPFMNKYATVYIGCMPQIQLHPNVWKWQVCVT